MIIFENSYSPKVTSILWYLNPYWVFGLGSAYCSCMGLLGVHGVPCFRLICIFPLKLNANSVVSTLGPLWRAFDSFA